MPNMATRIWLNFAIFLLCLPLFSIAQGCVGSCRCSTVRSKGQIHPERIVDCSGLSLSSVPSSIPTPTTQILLNNNKIGALDVNAFKLLPDLWKIDASNNQLQSVPNDIFKYNSKLREINLGNNPLTCDCNLYGLHNTSKHVSKFIATCAKPLAITKRDIKSLKLEDFCGGCLGVKLSGRGSHDKEYSIKLMAKCLGCTRVYCHAMNTSNPKEYITVSSRSNYASIYDYKQSEVAKYECERKPGGTNYSEAGQTNFTRIRLVLSPAGATLKTNDFLFASTTGKSVPLGVAGDCFSASIKNCRKGSFKIDLSGTGFSLKETVHWIAYGAPPNIQSTLNIDTERRVVSGECGGYCGGCKPDGLVELELDSCPEEGVKPCVSALGMDDHSINDAQITAFSNSPNHEPSNGRVNHVKTDRKGGSWCAAVSNSQQFLQIDLGKKMTFSGIATQGAGDAQNWVTKYKIQKSDDGSLFQDHLEFGMPLEYAGNTDNFNVVKNWFIQRFRARYVKIIPIEWHNAICLRTELYGCDNDMVSVAVRHKTSQHCWSPSGAKPCAFVDGTPLVLKPSCTRDGEMMAFFSDNTIRHTCSGRCAYVGGNNLLSLRNGACDEFVKKKMPDGSYQIIEQRTKYCVKLSDVKKGELSVTPCSQSSDVFEFLQGNISPLKPKIFSDKTNYLAVNKPGWVHCKVIADPRAKIFWTKARPWPGGQRLSKLEFIQWPNGSLYVRNTQMSYVGKYYCSAANTADFVFEALDIKVGTPPNITNGPTNTKVIMNHTAILNCVVAHSYLTNKITWYKQSLRDSTAISIDKLNQRFLILANMSLKIKNLKKSDEAHYTCESKNPLGSTNETAFLKVMIPPSIFIFPKDMEVPSSSSPMLNCKGVGDPAPEIKWSRKNGSTLPRSSKIYSNGSLFLRNIEIVDEDVYVCAATSDAGTVYTEARVKVYGACSIDSIPFATYLPNQIFFRVGTVIIIKCNHGYQSREGVVTNMTCVSDGVFDKALPKCKDIDECRVDPATDENNHDVTSYHDCDKNALCINTIGSYQCECSQGYKGNGTHCTPLCPRPTNPDYGKAWQPEHTYYDAGATINLVCAEGFAIVGNPAVTCESNGSFGLLPECQDIDECAVGVRDKKPGELTSACPDKNTVCKNIAGSYECNCKTEFESDGRGGCKVARKRRWKTSKAIDVFLKKLVYYKINNASTLMILESLLNATRANKESLTSGDLLVVYETLKSLPDKSKGPGSPETKKREFKVFVKICNTILADQNEEQWKNIQEDSKGVTQVMQVIEEYTAVMADDIIAEPNENSTLLLNNDNLDLKLEVHQAKSMYNGHQYPIDYQSSQVLVPGKVFQDYKSGLQIIRITGITYKSLGKLLPKRADGVKSFDIDSTAIVSTSLHPKPPMHDGKLIAPVRILLSGEKTLKTDSVAQCVFWDFEKNADLGGSWSAEGCRVISSASNGTVCECDHMTSFASLAVYDKPFVFTLVVYIACGVLLLVVIILVIRHLYLYCKRKSERSIIHLNLCFAIAAGVGIFVGTLTFTKLKIVCIVIAALLHYFLMAMFCWIISKCLQLYQTLTTGKNKNPKRVKWFYIIGWLFPAIIVGISLGVFQLKGYGNSEWCWLDYDNDMLMWAFAGPAAVLLFVIFIFIIICSIIKARVVDSSDKTKVSVSLAMSMLLGLAIAGTWVVAAIYVKHHQKRLWEYVFAGSCVLQAIILLLCGLLDKEIKNFSFIYQIKKIQQKEHKEKRNYYSTTDTVQYYGGANAPDGKTYTVTRPSAKEDLRGSSKRLSRIDSNQEVNEPEYPPPIAETPGPLDETYKRNVESRPIPYTPSFPNSEVIQLQTFPARRGYPGSSPGASDRQPDGAEYPEPSACNDRRVNDRNYRPSSPRTAESMSSHSRLAHIPERAPLMRGHREDESLSVTSDNSSRYERSPIYQAEEEPLTSDPSRRRTQRSRARLEERFKMDMDSIQKRKRKLRYSSGYLIGATIDDDKQANKDHNSL